MSVNIFVIIIDWIASVFVTIYNVIRNLGLSFIEYLLILFVILLACRLLAVVFGRLRLGRDLRRMPGSWQCRPGRTLNGMAKASR